MQRRQQMSIHKGVLPRVNNPSRKNEKSTRDDKKMNHSINRKENEETNRESPIEEALRKAEKTSRMLEEIIEIQKLDEDEQTVGVIIIRQTTRGSCLSAIGIVNYADAIEMIRAVEAKCMLRAIFGDPNVIMLRKTGEENG